MERNYAGRTIGFSAHTPKDALTYESEAVVDTVLQLTPTDWEHIRG